MRLEAPELANMFGRKNMGGCGGCPAAGMCGACPFKAARSLDVASSFINSDLSAEQKVLTSKRSSFRMGARLSVLPGGGAMPIRIESLGSTCTTCSKNPCQCKEKAA